MNSRKHLRANCRVLGDGSMAQDHLHVSRKPRTKRPLVDQAPTFEDSDHGKTSTDNYYPGHDRSWKKATKLVTPQQGMGPVTPISGGKRGDTPQKRRYSTIDAYVGGKSYDPIQGRVPDEKTWQTTAPRGPITETPSNVKVASPDDDGHVSVTTPKKLDAKRGEKVRDRKPQGWEERYGEEIRKHSLAEGMTATGTPQRKKIRAFEDGH